MNFPLEAMAELPEEAKAAFMANLEHMQVRDRWVLAGGRHARAPAPVLGGWLCAPAR